MVQIAIEGCCHGDLDKIYTTLQHLEAKQRIKVDLLICCGDFQASSTLCSSSNLACQPCGYMTTAPLLAQAVRNLDDLECLACPPKYRELKSFYKYYTGQLEPPIPTLFSEPPSAAMNASTLVFSAPAQGNIRSGLA